MRWGQTYHMEDQTREQESERQAGGYNMQAEKMVRLLRQKHKLWASK